MMPVIVRGWEDDSAQSKVLPGSAGLETGALIQCSKELHLNKFTKPENVWQTKGGKSYIHAIELYTHRNALQVSVLGTDSHHLIHIEGGNNQKELFVHDLRTVRRGRTATSHTDTQTQQQKWPQQFSVMNTSTPTSLETRPAKGTFSAGNTFCWQKQDWCVLCSYK